MYSCRCLFGLLTIILVVDWQFALVWSLQCPSGSRPYSPISCVGFGEEPFSFDAAQARCALDGGALLFADTQVQLSVASRYVETLGSAYWISAASVSGAAPLGGQCTAINATLVKTVNCSQALPRLCQLTYTATPTALLSTTPTSPTVGSAVTLTCSYSNSSSVSFQKDDVAINTTSVSLMASPTQLSLTLASVQAGRYDCVASNPLGAVKSTAIVVTASSGSTTVIGPITVMFNGVATSTPVTLSLGTSFNLSCSSTSSGLRWTWFRNGAPLTSSSSSVDVSDFNTYDTSGFYQCRALDPTSNSNAMGQLLILATAGIPAPLSTLAWALSQTKLQVLWSSPSSPNTDPALLRYRLLYGVGSPGLMYPPEGSYLQPSQNPLMNCSLSGLSAGTVYTVAVLSCSEVGCDTSHLMPTTAMTFGLVPSASVVGVTLTYDVLKQEIVVAWTPLVTQPPEGEVAFYEVQYGRSNSSLSTFRAHPPYNSLYLDGIPDDDYQARVRAAVKVQESPETYGYSPWSVWAVAPPTTPTVQTEVLRIAPPTTAIIVPSVLVPVVVVVGVVSLLLCYYCKTKSRRSVSLHDMKDLTHGGVSDGGVNDGGVSDGGVNDGGVSDGGVNDGGVSDGGVNDGGVSDGGVNDGGVNDGGVNDGGVNDDDGAPLTDAF
ncbi:hypothetical protein EMCRGX_G018893 [Ephydatia muelleri]